MTQSWPWGSQIEVKQKGKQNKELYSLYTRDKHLTYNLYVQYAPDKISKHKSKKWRALKCYFIICQ